MHWRELDSKCANQVFISPNPDLVQTFRMHKGVDEMTFSPIKTFLIIKLQSILANVQGISSIPIYLNLKGSRLTDHHHYSQQA